MMQTAGSAFFMASYILFASWTAVCLNIVFLIRNIVFYFKDKKWASHGIWLYLILALVVVAGSLGFKTYFDIIPIIGSIFGTVAAYMANRNIVTVDAGVPVLSMHAPIELVSKLDCYMTMLACKAIYLA